MTDDKPNFEVVCPYEDCLKGSIPIEQVRMEAEGAPKSRVSVKYKCTTCGRCFICTFIEGKDKPEVQKYTIPAEKVEKPKVQKPAETVDFDAVIKAVSVEVTDKIVPTGGEYQRGSLLDGLKLGS